MDDSTGEHLGFLSAGDVVNAFLAGIYPGLKHPASTPGAAALADLLEARVGELAAAGAEFCESPIRLVHRGAKTGRMFYKARDLLRRKHVAEQNYSHVCPC